MTYTFEQIREWKAEFDSIDPNIKGNLAIIESIDNVLPGLHQELQANLLDLQEALNRRLKQLTAHWNNSDEYEQELVAIRKKLKVIDEIIRQASLFLVMQDLNASADLFTYSAKLSGLIRLINEKLADRNNHAAANAQNAKRKERLKSVYFFDAFNHDIEGLYENLTTVVKDAINAYEAQYPADQSELVRKCIFEIIHGIVYLENRAEPQDRYTYLLGLIHDVSDRIPKDGYVLKKLIADALQQNHKLDVNEAKQKFDAYREHEYLLSQAYLDSECLVLERRQYDEVLQDYDEGMDEHKGRDWSKLYDSGWGFKQKIEDEKKSNPVTFDYKYFTKLLVSAKNVIANPADGDSRDAFSQLMDANLAGKSNRNLKWRGAGVILLGAALVVGSLLLGVSMFGISSPLVFAGCATGGLMILAGIAVCIVGRQKGVDKQGETLRKNSMFAMPDPVQAESGAHEKRVLIKGGN